MKSRGVAFKLNVSILSVVLLFFLLIFSYNYYVSRDLILKSVKENTRNLTSSAINKIESFFKIIEKTPINIGYYLNNGNLNNMQIQSFLKDIVGNNPEIYGSCIAFKPISVNGRLKYYAPYCWKSNDSICFKDLSTPDYFYPKWEWYYLPAKLHRPVLSEPYFDKRGGDEIMTTYSVPFYSCKNDTACLNGIVTVDVSLNWIHQIISSVRIFDTGYAFLISQKGTIISHPEKDYILKQTVFSLAGKYTDNTLKEIGHKMISGEKGFELVRSGFFEKKSWIYYTPLENSKWSLGLVIPEKELYAGLYYLNKALILIAVSGMIILFILIVIIADRITRPLRKLSFIAKNIGQGTFNSDIPAVIGNDEISVLYHSFNSMQKELIDYIKNLNEVTQAKEKTAKELQIAREIQLNMLPHNFSVFNKYPEIDVFGILEPAKEVGGDFYDFYFIDENNLFFAVGDVSGKGVPASLFMAVTVTILRSQSLNHDKTLTKLLEVVANYLKNNNENNFFVTLFIGIINLKSGELQYLNAGHNYPVIINADGNVLQLVKIHCIPLGIFPFKVVEPEITKLVSGDVLVVYTDGVTEAFNTDHEMYSLKRLNNFLSGLKKNKPVVIVDAVLKDVQSFSDGIEQADDITILAIAYNGKNK